MEFAVAECANRTFEEVCALLGDQPAEGLQTAAGSLATGLLAEAGDLTVVGPHVAVIYTRWRDRAGHTLLEGDLRVVGINRGSEPVTELLLFGHGEVAGQDRSSILAWAQDMLAELAGQSRWRRGDALVRG